MAGKIQRQDVKTEAELVTAGTTKADLINDTQIYVTATGINKTLDDAITDGDIGGGGGGGTPSQVRLKVGNGFGSTNTKIRRFLTTVENSGTDITYTDSAANGASFTVNTTGVYAITYTEEGNALFPVHGLSLNSSSLTTDIYAIPTSEIIAITSTGNGNNRTCASVTLLLTATDVVRMHTNNGGGNTFVDNVQVFSMVGPL